MSKQVVKAKIKGIVVLISTTLIVFLVIFCLENDRVDQGLILNIVGTFLLGVYGFPLYQGLKSSSTVSIKGTAENARALSYFGLFLFLMGFIFQLSFSL